MWNNTSWYGNPAAVLSMPSEKELASYKKMYRSWTLLDNSQVIYHTNEAPLGVWKMGFYKNAMFNIGKVVSHGFTWPLTKKSVDPCEYHVHCST